MSNGATTQKRDEIHEILPNMRIEILHSKITIRLSVLKFFLTTPQFLSE
jgi:hypothetical protein